MKILCNLFLTAVVLASAADLAVAQGKKGAGAAAAPASSAAQAATPTASSSPAIESQMLAYGGLDHIATAIAAEVCPKLSDPDPLNPSPQDTIKVPRSTVVIYDQ